MNETETETTVEQKKLMNLYAVFTVALISSVFPFASAAIISLIFFVLILIMAYVERSKAEEFSLVHNHAVYIIRTLWLSAFLSVVSMIAASIYMLGRIDYTSFEPCANALSGRDAQALQEMNFADIYPLVEPCMQPFIDLNMNIFVTAAAIGLAPPLIYISYRFCKGVLRATKGYRLADPKSLF